MKNEINRQIWLNARPSRVWEALTSAEHLARWFADDGATVSALEPGGEVKLGWADYGVVHAIIERVEPESYLSWRWSRPPGLDPHVVSTTLVEFTISMREGLTLLHVFESGFRELDLPPLAIDSLLYGGGDNWPVLLTQLRKYLER